MKPNSYRGQWAGSSHLTERREELTKAHEDFQTSELKKYLDEGWKIQKATLKPKRPRIKKQPKEVVISIGNFGTMRMSFSDYLRKGKSFQIVMTI